MESTSCCMNHQHFHIHHHSFRSFSFFQHCFRTLHCYVHSSVLWYCISSLLLKGVHNIINQRMNYAWGSSRWSWADDLHLPGTSGNLPWSTDCNFPIGRMRLRMALPSSSKAEVCCYIVVSAVVLGTMSRMIRRILARYSVLFCVTLMTCMGYMYLLILMIEPSFSANIYQPSLSERKESFLGSQQLQVERKPSSSNQQNVSFDRRVSYPWAGDPSCQHFNVQVKSFYSKV